MMKLPCLFVREFTGRGSFLITRGVTSGCEWALAGEGVETVKWDGTACMVKDGRLYKRYDAKRHPKTQEYKLPPSGAIPCSEPDPVTGHWPHWVEISNKPEEKWFVAAWDTVGGSLADGTYELCGPAINGNPYGFDEHVLVRHGGALCLLHKPLTFDSIRDFLSNNAIEGIVFHHPDGRMCKIRRHDFGLPWPVRL